MSVLLRPSGEVADDPLQAGSLALQGWGLMDLPLSVSNEALLRARVPRAQKIISPPSPPCSGSKGSTRVSFLQRSECPFEERFGECHMLLDV